MTESANAEDRGPLTKTAANSGAKRAARKNFMHRVWEAPFTRPAQLLCPSSLRPAGAVDPGVRLGARGGQGSLHLPAG